MVCIFLWVQQCISLDLCDLCTTAPEKLRLVSYALSLGSWESGTATRHLLIALRHTQHCESCLQALSLSRDVLRLGQALVILGSLHRKIVATTGTHPDHLEKVHWNKKPVLVVFRFWLREISRHPKEILETGRSLAPLIFSVTEASDFIPNRRVEVAKCHLGNPCSHSRCLGR